MPPKKDDTTEEKIKEAARDVFTHKGYSATRTRDIAEKADINLALLNYYFRSKEKLFKLVMEENLLRLLSVLFPIINNSKNSLEEKISAFAENYINLLVENPELPLFIFNELKNHPDQFMKKFEIDDVLRNTSFFKQISAQKPDTDPLQFMLTMLGMTIFPFVAKPLIFNDSLKFNMLMEERKSLIVDWSKAILKL